MILSAINLPLSCHRPRRWPELCISIVDKLSSLLVHESEGHLSLWHTSRETRQNNPSKQTRRHHNSKLCTKCSCSPGCRILRVHDSEQIAGGGGGHDEGEGGAGTGGCGGAF